MTVVYYVMDGDGDDMLISTMAARGKVQGRWPADGQGQPVRFSMSNAAELTFQVLRPRPGRGSRTASWPWGRPDQGHRPDGRRDGAREAAARRFEQMASDEQAAW